MNLRRSKTLKDAQRRSSGKAGRREGGVAFIRIAASSLTRFGTAALLVAAFACTDGRATPQTPALQDFSDSAFAQLVAELSEAGGFFDTDNLISNESSYLHAVGTLRESGVTGGVYVGVGPDQSFSYIAAIRPEVAFMVDIRRDNLLQHLMFKALFAESPTRVEYLSHWVGVKPPPNPAQWHDKSVEEVVAYVDGAERDPVVVEATLARIAERAQSYRIPLSESDRATIDRFHRTFARYGLDLKFQSYNRAPQPYYPTFRRLILERDLTGTQTNYLASRESYEVVRDLQLRNRIVPVVGDLAGDHALISIGRLIDGWGEGVSALYSSNVEFYLMRSGTFDRFADNVIALPRSPEAVIIRSYFGRFRSPHPEAVPGYASTQLVQPMKEFTSVHKGSGYATYWDLVMEGVTAGVR